MDRFLMKLSLGLPGKDEERMILKRFGQKGTNPFHSLKPVCGRQELLELKQAGEEIFLHPHLFDYLVDIVQATRDCERFSILAGVSPRGSLAFYKAVKAYAMVKGRDYVVPEDIRSLAVPVLSHRLAMPSLYKAEALPESVIKQVLDSIVVPTEEWQIAGKDKQAIGRME